MQQGQTQINVGIGMVCYKKTSWKNRSILACFDEIYSSRKEGKLLGLFLNRIPIDVCTPCRATY